MRIRLLKFQRLNIIIKRKTAMMNFSIHLDSGDNSRQFWLTMFFPLPPNSQLWIIHMVGYHSSRLRKSTLGQK